MPARRYSVKGRVQGVGFRAYVLRTAQDIGLGGEVWNCADGSVELIAEHPDVDLLDRLERELKDGPGRVDSVTWMDEPKRGLLEFTIGFAR